MKSSLRYVALILAFTLALGALPMPAAAATGPDLKVVNIWTEPAEPVGDQAATVEYSVKNQGDAAAGPFTTTLLIDGSELTSTNVAGLAAGSTTTYSTANVVQSGGAHTVRVVTDSNSQVTESNEGNNERQETITWSGATSATAAPDLVVLDVWTDPASPIGGQAATVWFAVKNQGDGASGSFRSKLYIDGSQYASVDWAGLAAGNQKSFSTPNVVQSAGAHPLRAVVDSQGQVAESNEGNNEKQKSITWSGGTTAAPSLSSASCSGCKEDQQAYTLTLTGSNFVNKPTISLTDPNNQVWGDQSRLTFVSSTQLTYTIYPPSGTAGTWNVKITNPDGQPSSSRTFTVGTVSQQEPQAVPVLSSVSCDSCVADSQLHTVTLTGSGFASTNTLTFTAPGGNTYSSTTYPARFQFVSSSQIKYDINPSTTSGTWSVRVNAQDGQQSATLNFNVQAPQQQQASAPVLSDVSCDSCVADSQLHAVTLTGTGFASTNTLTFTAPGGATYWRQDRFHFVSSTQIKYDMNPDTASGTWYVRVNAQDGQQSATLNFNVQAPQQQPTETPAAKPGIPTGLTPGQRSASEIDGELLSGLTANLAWSPPSGGATKYKVYYRAEPYTASPTTHETPSPYWTTPTLLCGTAYRWSVEAYNGATVGDIAPSASERMYFTTPPCEGTEDLPPTNPVDPDVLELIMNGGATLSADTSDGRPTFGSVSPPNMTLPMAAGTSLDFSATVGMLDWEPQREIACNPRCLVLAGDIAASFVAGGAAICINAEGEFAVTVKVGVGVGGGSSLSTTTKCSNDGFDFEVGGGCSVPLVGSIEGKWSVSEAFEVKGQMNFVQIDLEKDLNIHIDPNFLPDCGWHVFVTYTIPRNQYPTYEWVVDGRSEGPHHIVCTKYCHPIAAHWDGRSEMWEPSTKPHVVELRASNPGYEAVVLRWEITVKNSAPTIEWDVNNPASIGNNVQPIIRAHLSDPDGLAYDLDRYEWIVDGVPEERQFELINICSTLVACNSKTLEWQPDKPRNWLPGWHRVALRVTDGGGAVTEKTWYFMAIQSPSQVSTSQFGAVFSVTKPENGSNLPGLTTDALDPSMTARPSVTDLAFNVHVASDTSGPKTIMFDVPYSAVPREVLVKRAVLFDGVTVSRASSFDDVMHPTVKIEEPRYHLILGPSSAQVLVYVPHFSEHFIQVATVQDLGQAFVTPTGIIAMAAAAVVLATGAYGLGRRRARGVALVLPEPRAALPDEAAVLASTTTPKALLVWAFVSAIPALAIAAVILTTIDQPIGWAINEIQRLPTPELVIASVLVATPITFLIAFLVGLGRWKAGQTAVPESAASQQAREPALETSDLWSQSEDETGSPAWIDLGPLPDNSTDSDGPPKPRAKRKPRKAKPKAK